MGSQRVPVIAAAPLTRQNTSSAKLAQAVAGGGWLGLPHDLPPGKSLLEQYVTDAVSYYRNYITPDSWFCYR